MTFTNEWFKGNVALFQRLLGDRRDRPTQYIEVGAYEGRSLLWMFDNILTHPASFACVIDTFEGSAEHNVKERESLRARFDENTAHRQRQMYVLQMPSAVALLRYGQTFAPADVIYVDGSHEAKDVLADAVLTWELLGIGGILIFDDYAWEGWNDPVREPRMAIDAFLACYAGRYTLLEKSHVVAVKKEKD